MISGTEALLVFFAIFWGLSFTALSDYRLFDTHLLAAPGRNRRAWKRFGVGVLVANGIPIALVLLLAFIVIQDRSGPWALAAAAIASLSLFGLRRVIHALIYSDERIGRFLSPDERSEKLSARVAGQNRFRQHMVPGVAYAAFPVLICLLICWRLGPGAGSQSLTQNGSGTSSDAWSAVTGVGTLALAAATAILAGFTWKVSREAVNEVNEMRRDRDLSIRPVLVCDPSPAETVNLQVNGLTLTLVPTVKLRNIGSGPALNVVVWASLSGHVFAIHDLNVGRGEMYPVGPGAKGLDYVGPRGSSADPGQDVVGDAADSDFFAYCADQLGTGFQFNLRRPGTAPDPWPATAAGPRWARAWVSAGAAPIH